jgi:hypothetical protein
MHQFALWLAQTRISLAIQTHSWAIPTVQSIHIVAIGIVVVSVFMIDLRILGLAGTDQTLPQTTRRYAPWMWAALGVLLFTGALMVTGEPVRELMSLSFWLKMTMLVIGVMASAAFQISDGSREASLGMKLMAILTLLVWSSVIVLGRLIAYDHVWGRWSLNPR